MVWDTNTPAILVALRSSFAALTPWTSIIAGSPTTPTACHFPTANPAGYQGSAIDQLPLALFIQTSRSGLRYAEGGGSLPRGVIEVDIYVWANAYTAGQLETLGDALLDGLLAQATTIPWLSELSRTLADDPDPGSIAADTSANPAGYRTLRLTLPYGLNP